MHRLSDRPAQLVSCSIGKHWIAQRLGYQRQRWIIIARYAHATRR